VAHKETAIDRKRDHKKLIADA